MASGRLSTMSGSSTPTGARLTAPNQQSTQVSTTTLLNALHTAYTSGQPYRLDASTSLVVNTWLTAMGSDAQGHLGGTVDIDLVRQAWEHCRRRAEDGCILLGSLHSSTPSLLLPTIAALPLELPQSLQAALTVLRAFTSVVTPFNSSQSEYASLAATFSLSMSGQLVGASLAISTTGLDTSTGLLNIPAEAGFRAFDVFYYLLTSASTPAEREFLGLKHPSQYSLLNPSGTYQPPSYLPTADDSAAAEDFRQCLKLIGIKGSAHRNLLSTLAALLKLGDTTGLLVDDDFLESVCEDVGGLLSIDPEVLLHKCSADERRIMIAGVYESLVDWVLARANSAVTAEIHHTRAGDSSNDGSSDGLGMKTPDTDEDTVNISVLEIPGHDLGRAVALRGVFDDGIGINAEMKEDGIEVTPAGTSVIREMENAVSAAAMDLGIPATAAAREREYEHDRQLEVLEKLGTEADEDGFLRNILHPVDGQGIQGALRSRLDISHRIGSSRVWYHLSLHPTDESPAGLASLASTTSAWSAGTVSRQLRTWRLPEWANRRNKNLDFTADFEIHEFHVRYARLGCQDGRDGVESWLLERGWSNGEVVVGHDRVWMREGPWWDAESLLDLKNAENPFDQDFGMESGYSRGILGNGSGFFPPVYEDATPQDHLLPQRQDSVALEKVKAGAAPSIAPTQARTINTQRGDYGLGGKGDDTKGITYEGDLGELTGELDPEIGEPKAIISQPISKSRHFWVGFVWALTFWIPSFALRHVGRMKRPDVRFAWREKVVLVLLIFLLNATVIFYIIEFGRLLCPNFDKAWNEKEVGFHAGQNDFWVSFRGGVYDLSKFWKTNHATVPPAVTRDMMEPFGGVSMDTYIVPPLKVACQYLVESDATRLLFNASSQPLSNGIHKNGKFDNPDPKNPMHSDTWYFDTFLKKMETMRKGDLVYSKKSFEHQGQNQGRQWVLLNEKIYDLSDYYNTLSTYNDDPAFTFIPEDVSDLIKSNPGIDITSKWPNTRNFSATLPCLDHIFYKGKLDYRESPKCQVNNYILLAFTIILCSVILIKFLAALQLGSKRRPAAQDKFVICQVPAYTEGEDQLRKGLDSLTALQYDNKRKLICVICDGMIVGGGNDRPTPKIVLDILGVDPKTDPVALPFKSIGQGSEQLNYGKVYSGLYEYEGNVVPYIVVVKVGKGSEQTKSKPGNRGKRDSQILLLSFLNRVHHRSPMSPLELEMFHQINNIIGVDPELYEYLLMVDADTSVKEDSLNRLVASCANDAKVAGICGETSLENEERSWWTMIQVYEYYISHHLAKSFESLFGSVTCLPGCFCMYRLRTADKGRPLIISKSVIDDYATCDVDTLHKKNLLSLGEDRYLTTLMTKYFPSMSYKFIPDAYASTAAPETWSVLVSQRRRWINSTIHNLAELVWLKDLCGFCCFSMRFVVFIDLFGTIILPATCAYLGYLIYRVATHSGQFPLISIVMIAAVYGLQAIIFIIKRQWQHVGWMIIYILAFPIYSFVLPIFSFWSQDDFSWGSTRIVIGEKGNKQVVAIDDEGFDPRTVPLQRWDDYAVQHGLPGRRGYDDEPEKPYQDHPNGEYEMDDVQTVYSYAKPASTVLSGLRNKTGSTYLPPMSPAPFSQTPRHSEFGGWKDAPQYAPVRGARPHSRMQSFGGMSDRYSQAQPLQNPFESRISLLPGQSSDNLISMHSPPLRQPRGSPSPLGFASTPNMASASRPVSMIDFRDTIPGGGPSDQAITEVVHEVLAEIDIEATTKKTMKALVEQRLQTQLSGDKRAFMDRVIDDILKNMELD